MHWSCGQAEALGRILNVVPEIGGQIDNDEVEIHSSNDVIDIKPFKMKRENHRCVAKADNF